MKTYEGHCRGGPLNAKWFMSRYPNGFLLVNRPAGQIAIYDYMEEHGFLARTQPETDDWRFPESIDPNQDNRYRAALESKFDVFAYDPERMGPWQL